VISITLRVGIALQQLPRQPSLLHFGDAEDVIRGEARELHAERLPTLLNWLLEDPVEDYERHRNMAFAELHGNRNPLIDHPDWASQIDFRAGFG
jgi:hypothetical protein